MQSVLIAGGLFLGCLAASLVGFALRSRLVARYLDQDTRATVSNATGLIASMSALLLGLLVANAQNAYNSVSSGIDQMAANLVDLDRTLRALDAREARALLHEALTGETDRIWPPDARSLSTAAALDPTDADAARAQVVALIAGLPTQTDAQRNLQRAALELVATTSRTRVLILSQVRSDLPTPVVVVVSSWLVTLFLAFGLLARANAVTLFALVAAASSVGGALFLILELNRPFGGIMQIPPDSMRAALSLMAR